MVKVKTYNNGLKLIVSTIEGVYSVTMGINVMVGSCNESEKENGISHYIEHMLFKGTKKRSAYEICEEFDRIGAQSNAFTSKENTCFYAKTTKEHIETSFDVLSDIFFNSTFDEEEAEKEKGVIIEEINMCNDTPEDVCYDLCAKAFYGKQSFGKEILGSKENVLAFTKNDVLDYMKRYYTADNVVISLAGNIDFDLADELTQKYFVNNFKNTTLGGNIEIKPTFETGNLYAVKDIEQSHINIKLPSIEYANNKSSELLIANIILGGGMSSRLFQTIREKLGLAYSIYAAVSPYYKHGCIDIYAGVSCENRQKAYDEIVKEIQKFSEKGITKQEFERAKEQYKSSILFAQESTTQQMRTYAKHLLLTNEIYDIESKTKQINDISLDAIQEVIKNVYNTQAMAIATVGKIESAIVK